MAAAMRIALWNANGLSSHRLELQTFLDMHKIDIALISEIHFTSRKVFRLPRYTVFHPIHPDDTVHGGAAIIIRSSLRNHEHFRLQTNKMHAIAVHLEALPWPLTVSAVYCPPRHVPCATYAAFFQSLDSRFLVGGDWNAKHTALGARLITPKGRTLLSAICGCHCTYFSTGKPTYWPTDYHRIPDLLDFFVARSVTANYVRVESVFELSSDHSPIVATVGAHVLPRAIPPDSLQITLTGTYFVPILTPVSTLTYGSRNVVSWTTRRTTSLPPRRLRRR
jgi:exonuclease III